jgi:hypothetical protein
MRMVLFEQRCKTFSSNGFLFVALFDHDQILAARDPNREAIPVAGEPLINGAFFAGWHQ